MKILAIVLMVFCSLPLLVYPFVLLANVMSLAAERSSGPVAPRLASAAHRFVWSSFAYPIPYALGMLVCAWYLKKQHHAAAVTAMALPLLYLLLVLGLFLHWKHVESDIIGTDRPNQQLNSMSHGSH